MNPSFAERKDKGVKNIAVQEPQQNTPSVFEQPQCLIDSDSNGKLWYKTEVLEQIAELEQPLNIVAVVGLYRTGKSYLLNRLAGEHDVGFEIGPTVQAQTKGIWIWCRPHPTNQDQILLLMDTEGLGDVEKGSKTHDCWIFVLASLLSSTLVLNVKNVFDQDTLDKMSFITEMAKHIRVSEERQSLDAKDLDHFFPVFILVLRDFSLEMTVEGKSANADEYLENCLKSNTKKDRKYNAPRECLRKYFMKRKCFTLGCPAKSKLLTKLNTIADEQLDEDFCEESRIFTNFVLEQCPPKKLENGHMVNGGMFVTLVKSYVDSIQRGKLPCIEDALSTMTRIENTKAVDKCVELYSTKMTTSITIPTDLLKLSEAHYNCLKEAVDQFLRTAINDNDHTFKDRANVLISEKYRKLIDENEKVSIQKSREALLDLSSSLEQKLKAGEFAKPGGYVCFQSHLNEVEAKYEQLPGLGIKKGEILVEFQKRKQVEGNQILYADLKMSHYEREAEEKRQSNMLRENDRRLEKRRQEYELLRDEYEKRGRDESIALIQEQHKLMMEQIIRLNNAVLQNRKQELKSAQELDDRLYDKRITKAAVKIDALERETSFLRNQTQSQSNSKCLIM